MSGKSEDVRKVCQLIAFIKDIVTKKLNDPFY